MADKKFSRRNLLTLGGGLTLGAATTGVLAYTGQDPRNWDIDPRTDDETEDTSTDDENGDDSSEENGEEENGDPDEREVQQGIENELTETIEDIEAELESEGYSLSRRESILNAETMEGEVYTVSIDLNLSDLFEEADSTADNQDIFKVMRADRLEDLYEDISEPLDSVYGTVMDNLSDFAEENTDSAPYFDSLNLRVNGENRTAFKLGLWADQAVETYESGSIEEKLKDRVGDGNATSGVEWFPENYANQTYISEGDEETFHRDDTEYIIEVIDTSRNSAAISFDGDVGAYEEGDSIGSPGYDLSIGSINPIVYENGVEIEETE